MRKGWVKAVMAVFCVLLLNIGVWGCVLFGLWEYNVPQIENFYESAFCWSITENKRDVAKQITRWSLAEDLSNYNMQRMNEMKMLLSPKKTNFRYICYAPDGTILCGNVAEKEWEKDVYRLYTMEITNWASYDDAPVPTVTPAVIVDSMGSITGVSDYDEPTPNLKYTLQYGVLAPLSVEDEYADALTRMEWLEQWMTVILGVSIALIMTGLILLILLMRVAGRRPGREEVVLNWHDKIPYDLYLAIQAGLIILGIASILESVWYIEQYLHWVNVLWMVGSGVACSIFGVALLLTTVSRIKARTFFRNTIIWRICSLLWRGCKAIARGLRNAINAIPLVWRTMVLFVIYLAGALLTTILFAVGVVWFAYDGWAVFLTLLMIVAIPAWHGFALFLLCRWALQWKRMRAATQEIIAGKTDVKIESEKLYPDLKEHAEQLNDLGGAIDNAVNERMKSERFKSELITNVSHDLKTPLTSIINYVDLLKKEEIENPTAQEYIGVLDRKSQRLKKLTEDLVEASKASTGALAVNKDDLDLVQLIRQALGEYEEKLTNAGLSLVTNLPESEIRVRADGRHVWRVLDNLLNNCVKYALEGTRVYLDAAAWNGNAVITVKNISRNPLNVPAEQLVERFVRGDESRTTEGSGLGLSIARSLTELQGGQFGLDIDGDLFKAKVIFPMKEG